MKANYGEEVTLECIVSATPKPSKIYWYRTINSQNHFTYINEKFPGISGSSVETPSLTIKYVTPANEGSYICYARNAAGVSKSKPVKLVVEAGNFFLLYAHWISKTWTLNETWRYDKTIISP